MEEVTLNYSLCKERCWLCPPNLNTAPHCPNQHSAIPWSSSIHFNIHQTTKNSNKKPTHNNYIIPTHVQFPKKYYIFFGK